MAKVGRPKAAPQKITVSISQHNAEELKRLAQEAGVSVSTLCAHVLERYATQDHTLMTNDVLAARLTELHEQHMRQFAQRFSDVLLRQAHETVALRRQMLVELEMRKGADIAREVKEASWQEAVKTLRPHTQKVRGESGEAET